MSFFSGLLSALPGAVAQGLIWGLMAIGVFITSGVSIPSSASSSVEPGYLLHPADRSGTLYVMGQYRIDPAMGKYIVMYYGSFKRAYRHLDEDELTEEMRKVLRHEFRHHVEGRAGVRDLEVWDAEQIAMYKEQQADNK